MLSDADQIALDEFLCSAGPCVSPDRESLLPIGTMLGPWRVMSLIGRGGSGEVYRVTRSKDSAALKILARDDEASRVRFAQEGRVLAENPTSFLPRLIDSGEWRGRPYLVIELLEPVDLPTTDSAVADYLLSVCEAVASLHRIGLVHRDLKPTNIMRRPIGSHDSRDRDGASFVLIDFGIAKDVARSPLCRPGVTIVDGKAAGVGTPGYAAPEQMTGGEVSPAADIHALGCIANALFDGKPPRQWVPIIRRATSSIPERRYETVEDLAAAIRTRNRSRRLLRVGFAVAVLASFAGMFLGRDEMLLVRDVVAQRQFDVLCENAATNIVTQQLLWEKLETNELGMVYLKERAFRNVTNAIDVTLVRLNGATNVFLRPLKLKANREYWVTGPGILDAAVTSAGTNTTIRLENCIFRNRSSVPLSAAGIRYEFRGGTGLDFPNMERPEDFVTRQFEGFDGAFDAIRFKGESSERLKGLGVGEEVQESHVEDSVVVVIPGLKRVVGDDELLEGVAGVPEREGFLCPLFGIGNHVGGLDVDSARPLVDDEVNLIFGRRMSALDSLVKFDDADVDRISPPQEFVVDDVFHEVGFLGLPEVYPCVAKSGVGGVVFHGEVKVVPSADVVALGVGKDEGIFETGQVPGYSAVVGRNAGSSRERVGDSRWIERTGDIAHSEVDDTLESSLRLDFVSLDDVAQIDRLEKVFEIGFLFGGRMHKRTFRKSSVDEIVVQSGEGIGALRGELAVFGKRERSDMDNLTASAKLGRDIRSQQPRVGAGHIDIDIGHRTHAAQDRVKSQISPFFFVWMNTGRIDVGVPFALTKLNFIYQNIITDSIVNQTGIDEVLQCGWCSEGLCARIFKIDFDDVVFWNTTIEQMRLKEVEQEITLSTAANASENLDKIIVFSCNQPIQQFCSYDVHSCRRMLNFSAMFVNLEAASYFTNISVNQEVPILYHICAPNAMAKIFYFPRHILCSKHEYITESMKKEDIAEVSSDEGFAYHLDPNRVRTNAEIQLFADVFSISKEDARRILINTGHQCEPLIGQT